MGNCGYRRRPGALLQHLYGRRLVPRDGPAARRSTYATFDQRPYAKARDDDALADSGWVYVPAILPPALCGVPPARRVPRLSAGCVVRGDRFVRQAGYLEWATSNQIVVLFPQIEAALQPLNPNGCWDWWGYEDSRYALREGPQMLAVRAMIADLRGETPR